MSKWRFESVGRWPILLLSGADSPVQVANVDCCVFFQPGPAQADRVPRSGEAGVVRGHGLCRLDSPSSSGVRSARGTSAF